MSLLERRRQRRQEKSDRDRQNDVPTHGVSARYVRLVRALRYVLVPGWIIGALAMVHFLPALSSTSSGSILSAAVTKTTPAIEARLTAVHDFAVPLLSQTVVVQHRAEGLSASAQANTVARAAQLDAHTLPGLGQIAGAIPITNVGGLFPTSRQSGTTAVTYLLFRPSVSSGQRTHLTQVYAQRYLSSPGSGLVGTTGVFAASDAESNQLSGALSLVELAASSLVVVVVGLAFRSVLAPIITLVSAGIAYFISQRVLEIATIHLGTKVPAELSPIIVVLLLGIMTDYAVFCLSGFRDELRGGRPPRAGLLRSGTQVAPIVLTAGLTVAASVAVIETAKLPLFSELGPGLAITVLIGVLVSVSFVPAAIAVCGRLTYWPSHPRPAPAEDGESRERPGDEDRVRGLRGLLGRLTVRPRIAGAVLVLGIVALVAGASPLRGATIGVNLISVLPSSTAPAKALTAAGQGFAPGIVAPTEVILTGKGLAHDLTSLSRLQGLIAHQPGVAGVIGPADKLTSATFGLFVSKSHHAARYLVILGHDPTSAPSVHSLEHLQAQMSGLVSRSGLPRAAVAYAGDTALSVHIVQGSDRDLIRVGLFTLAVDFLILVIFLRSLVAPLMLVIASALVVAASLGITTWLFTGLLGGPGFTFYVPFAAEVLLISFGSDYNLYLVGRIWETEEEMPMRQAIAHATGQASSAINIAGITLAGSFATLALVDLRSFRALAAVMFIGLIIDTFFVRSFVVPSALSLLGQVARWPRHARRTSKAGSQGPP